MAGLTGGDEQLPANPSPNSQPIAAADESADESALVVSSLEPRRQRRAAAGMRWTRWARWRRPLVGALTAALVIAVAVGLFVRSTSNPGAALAHLLGAPPPATAPATTDNAFAAAHGVPWGMLTISGQRMSVAAMAGDIFQLAPGAHTVEYRAADFPTLHCIVSVPRKASDTCPLARPADVSDTPQAYSAVRLLDLRATPDRLNPTQRAALLEAISQALAMGDATTTIAPGELYVDANGNTQRASEPLRYSITPELATARESQQHVNALGHTPCGNVCASWVDLSSALTSANQSGWRVDVMIKLTRTVSDMSGQRFTQAHADALDIGAMTLLVKRAEDGWWIAPAAQGQYDLGEELQARFCPAGLAQAMQGGKAGVGGMYLTLLPRNPADGCVIAIIQTNANPDNANRAANAILVIVRFGVMQAANAAARSVFANLALADTPAQTIATQTFTSLAAPIVAGTPSGGSLGGGTGA